MWTNSLWSKQPCMGCRLGLMAKAHLCHQWHLVGLGTRELPFEGQWLACYRAWIETAFMTEGLNLYVWNTLDVLGNVWQMHQVNAQKCSIIKWKWFTQDHATQGIVVSVLTSKGSNSGKGNEAAMPGERRNAVLSFNGYDKILEIIAGQCEYP